MHPAAPRSVRRLFLVVGILTTALPLEAAPPEAEPLRWQPDYAAAIATAQAAHQHIVVLLAAPDAESGRTLETEVLRAPLIREALADMVWVRVENDADLEARLGAKEHPTLAFVNPFTGGVLHRVSGEKSIDLLAREIVHARRAIGIDLTAGLEEVAARMFAFDAEQAEKLLEAGDAAGLCRLLAPAAADDSRQANYLVAQVTLPAGVVADDVRFLAGADCLVGSAPTAAAPEEGAVAAPPDLAGSCEECTLPPSGVLLIPCPRESGAELEVRITAPGCRLTTDTVRFAEPAPGTAVQVRSYDLCRLADAEAARLSGRVLKPDGTPAAAAIVRIDDWFDTSTDDGSGPAPAITRTDADGRFTFQRVSPGRWLVRAECPGGEQEQVVDLEPAGHASCQLALRPVTTVGLRWVLQTNELVQDLAGGGTRTGEAYVSVASSRITLARGMRLRTGDACDLALARTPIDDATLPAETRRELATLPPGTPVWYLVDAAYTAEFLPISGLHRDPRPFAAIGAVSDAAPLPDQEWAIIGPILPRALAEADKRRGYFQLLRGAPVRQGDVFTLRCATSNCFAKLEVTDVTIVTLESRPRP